MGQRLPLTVFGWTLEDENTCPIDLDGSGEIDFGDLLMVLEAWGEKDSPADLDGSGVVDFGDILLVLDSWGTVCP